LAGIWNIDANPVHQGAEYEVTLYYLAPGADPSNPEAGPHIDLTGCAVEMRVKPVGKSAFTLSATQIAIVDAPSGKVRLHLLSSETDDYRWELGQHEIYIIWPGNVRKLWLEGTFRVNRELE